MICPISYATFYGAELMVQMIKNTIWVQTVVVSYDLSELNGVLDQKSIDAFELKSRLRDILVKIADNNRYQNEFIDLFYWRFFLQSTLMTCSVGLSLFLLWKV